jgi:hypothetical protein
LPQRLIDRSVARFVFTYFVDPKCPVRFWLDAMYGTAVPEAAIHEYGDTIFGENEVGPTNHRRMETIAEPGGP